jgi:predicted Zn-dependent protease
MAMESEEELAGVIAHEIAHVSARHISKKIERSKKIGMATLAGAVAGILLGASGASEAAGAAIVGSSAAGQSASLAFSREDEAQADQIGLENLNRAGYSARGLLLVLKKMRDKQWIGSDQVPAYLLTHPASEDRMAYIDVWIEKYEKVQTNIDPYPFVRTHTWLIASYGDENAALKKFEADVKTYPKSPLAHYGYGLVLARLENYDDAIDQLKKALERNAFEQYFIRDLGRIYFLSGRYPEALNILESAESFAPNHPKRLFYLGRTQIKLERFMDATVTFEKLISIYPKYSQAYYYLGEAWGRLGKQNYAHYYLGIYYRHISNRKNALFHLEKALATIDDSAKRAKIEEMLTEIRKKKHK